MTSKIIIVLLLTSAIFIAAGCSNQNNPVAPTDSGCSTIPVGITDALPDGSPAAGMGALGMFTLSIDPQNATAELTPLRQGALTDVLEVVDITNFMQLSPCRDCAKIGSVGIDLDGNLVLSIGIKHPFDVGKPLSPITGKNRADLHVFNVEGTVVSNLPGMTYGGIHKTVAGFTLINADGYSGYLDDALDNIYPTDASIHPYIQYFDDYSAGNFDALNPMGFQSVTDPPPSGNLVMAMGCDYDYRDYVIKIGNDPMSFIFVVSCTYAVSTSTMSERFFPEYRVPQHNKKAASEISIEIVQNDLASGDTGSTAEIEVHILDINHGVEIGNGLDQMLADSSVDDIFIDIPGITSTPAIIDGNNPISGTGHDPSSPLVYSATITNEEGAEQGIYTGLVRVTDSYLSGQNLHPYLSGMDGISRVEPSVSPFLGLFAISEFETYQTFSINVSSGVIYVDDSYTGPPYDGTTDHPYNTIQEALAVATFGNIIWVDDSGNQYEGPVEMVEGVKVKSVNWDDSDGDIEASIHIGSSTSCVQGADDATIQGFEIEAPSCGIECNDASMNITDCNIINITGSNARGIWLHDGSYAHLDGVDVFNFTKADHKTAYGILVEDCDAVLSNKVIIENTTVHHSPAATWDSTYGIRIVNSAGAQLDYCTVHDLRGGSWSYLWGISVSDSDNTQINHCVVNDVSGTNYSTPQGIMIHSSDGVTVYNSIVNDISGLHYDNAYGIKISDSVNVEIVNDVIYDIRKYYDG
jgi:hypothetical protein